MYGITPAGSTSTETKKEEPKNVDVRPCQCSFFSGYTGKKVECERCKGKDARSARLAFYSLLQESAEICDGAGETKVATDLRTYASCIMDWYKS